MGVSFVLDMKRILLQQVVIKENINPTGISTE